MATTDGASAEQLNLTIKAGLNIADTRLMSGADLAQAALEKAAGEATVPVGGTDVPRLLQDAADSYTDPE